MFFNKKLKLNSSLFVENPRYYREKDNLKYTGYLYKNKLPITLAQKKNIIFLEIKLFEAHKEIGESFIKSDYQMEQILTKEYVALNYFNGCDVSKFDESLFSDICEYIYQKYIENNDEVYSPI